MNQERTNEAAPGSGGLWPMLVSGAGNVLLLLTVVWSCRGGRPEAPPSSMVFQPLAAVSEAGGNSSPVGRGSRMGWARSAGGETGLSVWARLAVEDPSQFATNLREVGCPTETICDVLRPVIERGMSRRLAAASYETNFWMTGPERAAARAARERARERVMAERDGLLSELGCPVGEVDDGDGNLTGQFAVELVGGILPLERRRGLVGVATEVSQARERWRRRIRGVLLPEERQAIEAESAQFSSRVRAAVTDAELAELTLRVQATGMPGTGDEAVLAQVKVTPDEFRKLVPVLAEEYSNAVPKLFTLRDLLDDNDDGERLSAEAKAAEVRRILSAERGEEFLMRMDAPFPVTTEWTEKLGLPADTSRRVHEVIGQFEQGLAGVRERWSADPDRGRQMFEEWRDRTRTRLESVLARVPATERDPKVAGWLRTAARRGWGQP